MKYQYDLMILNFQACEQKINEYEKVFFSYRVMEKEFMKENENKILLEAKNKELIIKGKNDVNNVKKEILKRDEQIQNIRSKFLVIIQDVCI